MVNLWNPKVRANSITVPIRANSSWPGSPSSAERFLASRERAMGPVLLQNVYTESRFAVTRDLLFAPVIPNF